MTFKKRATKSIALTLMVITVGTPMLNTVSAMETNVLKNTFVQHVENHDVIVKKVIENIELNKEQIEKDYNNLSKDVSSDSQRGVGSMTAKVVRTLLIKYKSKIITLLKKLPYGDKIASTFNKYFSSLISFLDGFIGGAYEAIYKFFRGVGFNHFWSDLFADGIMTVLGWLL